MAFLFAANKSGEEKGSERVADHATLTSLGLFHSLRAQSAKLPPAPYQPWDRCRSLISSEFIFKQKQGQSCYHAAAVFWCHAAGF